jgi:hypothetical protein
LTGHATGDGVDCESDVYALCAEHVGDFSKGVLGFCDGHAVPDNLEGLVAEKAGDTAEEGLTIMTLSAFASASTVSSTFV